MWLFKLFKGISGERKFFKIYSKETRSTQIVAVLRVSLFNMQFAFNMIISYRFNRRVNPN